MCICSAAHDWVLCRLAAKGAVWHSAPFFSHKCHLGISLEHLWSYTGIIHCCIKPIYLRVLLHDIPFVKGLAFWCLWRDVWDGKQWNRFELTSPYEFWLLTTLDCFLKEQMHSLNPSGIFWGVTTFSYLLLFVSNWLFWSAATLWLT